ncbi:MAG: winged helix-turn-helix domain-containing protein [Candidatus Bathyarchaeia archaeon]
MLSMENIHNIFNMNRLVWVWTLLNIGGRGRLSYLQIERKALAGLPLQRKYRSHFEIIALMLENVKEGEKSRFTIMKRANINSKQLGKYLRILLDMGFVNMVLHKGQLCYQTSEKGIEFLNHYYALLDLLSNAASKMDVNRYFCDVNLKVKTGVIHSKEL